MLKSGNAAISFGLSSAVPDPKIKPSKNNQVEERMQIKKRMAPQKTKQHRGEACDFDFCEECYLEQLNSRRCTKGHVLASLGTSKDNGWLCDGAKEGGCRSKDRSQQDQHGSTLSYFHYFLSINNLIDIISFYRF